MAGPCAVESREQVFAAAAVVSAHGARFLRGGAYKTRTAPNTFQGLGRKGLELLREAAEAHGLLTVTEILAIEDLDASLPFIDLVQLGSRNMQNVPLLRGAGPPARARAPEARDSDARSTNGSTPPSTSSQRATRTWCSASAASAPSRHATRFTLDVARGRHRASARIGLPVIVDPSHAAGQREWVECLTLAGVASGADGLLIETHPDPDQALSDGPQAVPLSRFGDLMDAARRVAEAVGRSIPCGAPASTLLHGAVAT